MGRFKSALLFTFIINGILFFVGCGESIDDGFKDSLNEGNISKGMDANPDYDDESLPKLVLEVVSEFPAGNGSAINDYEPAALAYGNNHFWLIGRPDADITIRKMNSYDGLDSFPLQFTPLNLSSETLQLKKFSRYSYGLAFRYVDGNADELWLCAYNSDSVIYRYTNIYDATGDVNSIAETIRTPSKDEIRGMTFDGDILWLTSEKSLLAYELHENRYELRMRIDISENVIGEFKRLHGVAIKNNYLYVLVQNWKVSGNKDDLIIKVDSNSGDVIAVGIISSDSQLYQVTGTDDIIGYGLAFDGSHFWISVANGKFSRNVFKINISESVE